jgi:hypothetical protein
MTVDLATAQWWQVVVVTIVLGCFVAGFWWVSRIWERTWCESLESRVVDRRFLRWQRTLFRGRYPLGHTKKPEGVAIVRFLMLVSW